MFGQASDVSVDTDLLSRLDVSPICSARAYTLHALELLFGEKIFEDK